MIFSITYYMDLHNVVSIIMIMIIIFDVGCFIK